MRWWWVSLVVCCNRSSCLMRALAYRGKCIMTGMVAAMERGKYDGTKGISGGGICCSSTGFDHVLSQDVPESRSVFSVPSLSLTCTNPGYSRGLACAYRPSASENEYRCFLLQCCSPSSASINPVVPLCYGRSERAHHGRQAWYAGHYVPGWHLLSLYPPPQCSHD